VAYSFEKLLQISPRSVLHRSCYGQQIRDLLSFVPRERVFFVVLETMRDRYDAISQELLKFIKVDPAKMPPENSRMHSNAGVYPRSQVLQNTINSYFPAQQSIAYHTAMPFAEDTPSSWQQVRDFTGRALSKLNRSSNPKAPPMREETKLGLDAYFAQECVGLSEIINIDLANYWFQNEHI
jgi:hypothetical protein